MVKCACEWPLSKIKSKIIWQRVGQSIFSASNEWISNFKKKNSIVFKKNYSESSSVDNNMCSTC